MKDHQYTPVHFCNKSQLTYGSFKYDTPLRFEDHMLYQRVQYHMIDTLKRMSAWLREIGDVE